jgi:hypothetical protein
MTVTAVTPKNAYTAAGSPVFPYTFTIFDATEVLVYYNGAQILTGFTVDGVGTVGGGNVTLSPTPPNGTKILLVRQTIRAQGTDWTANDPDPAESKERAFDKAMNIDQEQDDILTRTPQYDVANASIVAPRIATPVVGQFLQFADAAGNIAAAVPALGTALSNPVALTQGGTGLNVASIDLLMQSLGASRWKTGASLTAAAALPIPNPLDGNRFPVTGNTTITSLASAGVPVGAIIVLAFSGTPQLTSSASLQMLGATNHTAAASEEITFEYLGGGAYREISRIYAIDPTFAGKFWRGDGMWAAPLVLNGIVGLALANNAGDAVNDIDIALGSVASDDADPALKEPMYLTAGITKRLDANWAVGTNQGGLDTGAVANNTYHMFLIKRVDTGVVDVLFSLSPTAPTMPANYTKKQRIGSIVRAGGTILAFIQFGDDFYFSTPPALNVNTTNPGTSAVTATSSVPTGLVVKARLNVIGIGGTNQITIYISPLSAADVAASSAASPLGQISTPNAAGAINQGAPVDVWTNTAAQFRYRLSASGAADIIRIATLGWNDPLRGRN